MKFALSTLILALTAVAAAASNKKNLRGSDAVQEENILARLHLAPTAKVEFFKIGDTGIAMISTASNEDDTQVLNKALNEISPEDENDVIRLWQKVAPENEVMPAALVEAAEEARKALTESHDEGDDRRLQANCNFYEDRTGKAVVYRFTRQLKVALTVTDGTKVGVRISRKMRSPNPKSPFPWERICAHCPYENLVSKKDFVINLRVTSSANNDVRVETFDADDAVFDLEVCYS